MKSNSERIADLEKAVNDSNNRYRSLLDRVKALEDSLTEFQSLMDAADNATVQLNMQGA